MKKETFADQSSVRTTIGTMILENDIMIALTTAVETEIEEEIGVGIGIGIGITVTKISKDTGVTVEVTPIYSVGRRGRPVRTPKHPRQARETHRTHRLHRHHHHHSPSIPFQILHHPEDGAMATRRAPTNHNIIGLQILCRLPDLLHELIVEIILLNGII